MAKVLHFILSLLYQCAELVVLRVGAVYQLRCSTCWYCVSAVLCYVLVSDVKLELFSKSKLESKKSIKTRNSFLIVS